VYKSDVGQELNLIGKIKIYENFIYAIGFGYFFPGSVYDNNQYNNSTTIPPASQLAGKTADPAWNLLTNLKYSF
jgi:hypothetical protein